MNRIKNIVLLLLVLIFGACEEPFIPPIQTIENELVVEALLTDIPMKLTVRLSRTSSFNNEKYGQAENHARVLLNTSDRNRYSFNSLGNGFYESREVILTKPNTAYSLSIQTADGETYESDFELMSWPVAIESLEISDTVYTEVNYDPDGNGHAKDYNGLMFKVKPADPGLSGVGFLYKWKVLTNYNIETEGLGKINYFCWEYIESKAVHIYSYNLLASGNNRIIDDFAFLSYHTLSPFPIDSSRFKRSIGSVFTDAFYYEIEQFTINPEATRFWTGLKNQSEATGKLFDPIDEQLISNITCTSDSTRKAYGFFTVASYSNRSFRVKIGSQNLFGFDENNFFPEGVTHEDCLEEILPSFWIW